MEKEFNLSKLIQIDSEPKLPVRNVKEAVRLLKEFIDKKRFEMPENLGEEIYLKINKIFGDKLTGANE